MITENEARSLGSDADGSGDRGYAGNSRIWRQPVSGAGLQTSIRGAQLDVQTADVLGSGELSWPEVTIVPGLAQKTRGELRLGWVLHFPACLVLDFGTFS